MFKDNYKARSNTSPPIWKEQVREDGGRRYHKWGSAYAIRINREAIHRKDRGGGQGKGRAGKGEGSVQGWALKLLMEIHTESQDQLIFISLSKLGQSASTLAH